MAGLDSYHEKIQISKTKLSIKKRVNFGTHDRKANKVKITEFSRKSRANLYDYLMNSATNYQLFITLTIRQKQLKGDDFKFVVDKYLKYLIKHINLTNKNTDNLSICWFLEFQKNGNPHLHMYVGGVKGLYVCRFTMGNYWGLNCLNDAKVAKVGHNITKMYGTRESRINYGMKYARKNEQKQVPDNYTNVGRFWGIRGIRKRKDKIIIIKPTEKQNINKQKEIKQAREIIKSVISDTKKRIDGYLFEDHENTTLFLPYSLENRETIIKIMYEKIKYLLELNGIKYELWEYYDYEREFNKKDGKSWIE